MEEEQIVKVVMPIDYETGNIAEHFGKASCLKLYELRPVDEGIEIKAQIYGTEGEGHSALAGAAVELGADVLVCGGIGMGSIQALMQYDIKTVPGVSGPSDEALKKLVNGELQPSYQPTCGCHRHSSEDNEGCGCHGHDGSEDKACGCGGHDSGSGKSCGCE